MGTIPTKYLFEDYKIYNSKTKQCEKQKLYEEKNNILYTYEVTINYSTLDYIKKNTLFKLYLCENDLLLENNDIKFNIIYQKINTWFYNKNTFGFNFTIDNKINRLIFNLDNSIEISNNIKNITYELVEYYKNIYKI